MAFTAVAESSTSFTKQTENSKLFLLKEDGDFLLKEDGDKIITGFGSSFAGQVKPTSSYSATPKP